MDSHSTFPVDSVIAVHGLDKQWSRFGQRVSPYVRRQRHRTGGQEEDHLTDESDLEGEKERNRDGTTTRDHPEGFEITV